MLRYDKEIKRWLNPNDNIHAKSQRTQRMFLRQTNIMFCHAEATLKNFVFSKNKNDI